MKRSLEQITKGLEWHNEGLMLPPPMLESSQKFLSRIVKLELSHVQLSETHSH